MPLNPFVKTGSANLGKVPVRPEAIEPVPEAYVGTNHPYRGTETHGVEDTVDPLPGLEYGTGRLIEYDDPPTEPAPIPVKIVTEGGREIKRFRPVISYAGGTTSIQPRMILGADDARSQATIKNINTAIVWIGHEPEYATALSGYPLRQYETYVTQTQEQVYASIEQAADAQVHILIEYATAVKQ